MQGPRYEADYSNPFPYDPLAEIKKATYIDNVTNAEYYLYNDELVPGARYVPDVINYDEYPTLDLVLADRVEPIIESSNVKPVYYHSRPITDPFDDSFLNDLQ